MTDPTDATVLPFPTRIVPPRPEEPSASILFELSPDPDPTVPTSKPRKRKPATLSRTGPRPRPKPREPRTPEAVRALEIAEMYAVKQPLCDKQRVADAIETAIRVGSWSDGEIVAAVERLVDSPYGVTENTLRIQLVKHRQPASEINPRVHEAIDAALDHLNALDSETMTETERGLAAALRMVCVAVMRPAGEAVKEGRG